MITRKQLNNGFEYLEIVNRSAQASLALQGAHLFKYQSYADPAPLLWLSRASYFQKGKAIRGGVPICWPWFGKHPTDPGLPQHGFARTMPWELIAQNETDAQQTELVLRLQDSPDSLKLWSHNFELLLKISIGDRLILSLTTSNRGSKPFTVTSALHSYFMVSDISRVEVKGLDQALFIDTLSRSESIQRGSLVIDKEVDRIFQKVRYPLAIIDRNRTITINATGSSSAVVWNPWQTKSMTMADMNRDSYQTMLCVETTNALADGQKIAPGGKHSLTAALSTSPLSTG